MSNVVVSAIMESQAWRDAVREMQDAWAKEHPDLFGELLRAARARRPPPPPRLLIAIPEPRR